MGRHTGATSVGRSTGGSGRYARSQVDDYRRSLGKRESHHHKDAVSGQTQRREGKSKWSENEKFGEGAVLMVIVLLIVFGFAGLIILIKQL